MHLLPVRTPLLQAGDDIASIIMQSCTPLDGDILVVSSKALATVEGAAMDLGTFTPGAEASLLAAGCGRTPAFVEAVLHETRRLHGTVRDSCPGALLTELRPDGLRTGTILVANAGLDESNVAPGHAIGWPHDPVQSMQALYKAISIPIILTDSCVKPRRLGVTAFAIACVGCDPFRNEIGAKDLFEKPLHITVEAVADQLAVAANILMGNAAQSIPAVLVREHGIPHSDFCGWVDGIEPKDDLFAGMLGD